MVRITVYQDPSGCLTGFSSRGHASAGEYGSDVVCAAVSVLVINTVNSIQTIAGDSSKEFFDEKDGEIRFFPEEPENHDTQVLMQSLLLGLQSIEEEHDRYLDLIIQEV